MHLRTFTVENFGPIRKLHWDPGEVTAGWHVFIGDNGAGKSTLLKALSLAMVGHEGARGLRIRPESLHRRGADPAEVSATLSEGSERTWRASEPIPPLFDGHPDPFHAAFGPIRRFVGSNAKASSLRQAYPQVARHLSLFDEDWALSEVIDWMKDLKLDMRDGEHGPTTLSQVRSFLRSSDLLPRGVELLDVTSEGPMFRDPSGERVALSMLSDGYQSVIGLTLELLRQLFDSRPFSEVLGSSGGTVETAGIILIDEIDAHLHPTWQQRIGGFFTKHFPNMQFLVTSHSPLVCRAAENGSIFRLPRPGDPDDEGGMVTGVDRDRLIFGDVLDAYGTEVFGSGVARSEQGRRKLERLGELNVKARFGELLSATELVEQRALQAIFTQAPMSPEDL